jgi:hypothetical protein
LNQPNKSHSEVGENKFGKTKRPANVGRPQHAQS